MIKVLKCEKRTRGVIFLAMHGVSLNSEIDTLEVKNDKIDWKCNVNAKHKQICIQKYR